MSATATLLTLALLGLSTSAFASDLDEAAPFDQAGLGEGAAAADDGQNRRKGSGARGNQGNRPSSRPQATPSRGRGQTAHRPAARRPATTVHGHHPHGRPGPAPVHAAQNRHAPHVRYAHVRPYHGVFVYGPRPTTHVRYVHAGPGPVRVVRDDLPEREVDREGSVALGIRGGSLISGSDGYLVGDPGVGGFLRVRPEESVGLELALSHHAGRFPAEETRAQTQVAGSVELFAFPWTRVSPYLLGGVTWNGRTETDEFVSGNTFTTLETSYAQWGLHGGLGLELALGRSAAIDLEARTIGWLNREHGDAPLALQATGGLLFHF